MWPSLQELYIKLVNVLGQESFKKIKIRDTHKKMSFPKVKRTDKPVFLKVIWKELFFGFNSRYAKDNTIVIDGSPSKQVLNSPENVILFET